MMTEPPPPPEPPPIFADAEPDVRTHLPMEQRADGTLVIDLTALVPPLPLADCVPDAPDPFNPEILVCEASGPSPRLGQLIGPVGDGFASAIPRARINLSDTASAEASLHNTPVGGFNANGGEVRLKIDF
jgi:hypothetical protein